MEESTSNTESGGGSLRDLEGFEVWERNIFLFKREQSNRKYVVSFDWTNLCGSLYVGNVVE